MKPTRNNKNRINKSKTRSNSRSKSNTRSVAYNPQHIVIMFLQMLNCTIGKIAVMRNTKQLMNYMVN